MIRSLSLLICIAAAPAINAWSLADRILGRAPPPRVFRRWSHHTTITGSMRPSYYSTERMMSFAAEESFSSVGDIEELKRNAAGGVGGDTDDTMDLVATIVKAADGRKADNIVALYVAPVTTMTRYMIFVTGNSRPQNQAIANAVKNDVEDAFQMRPGATGVPEGSADSGWMLLDYGGVMLHIMTQKSRLYYNIEGQWKEKGGKVVDISEYLIPNGPIGDGMVSSGSQQAEEQDPFWS